jgi:hypothetical protein
LINTENKKNGPPKYLTPGEKKKKYNWMKMGKEQMKHWTKIAQEKINLSIIENTSRMIYCLEYDYHSPQSEILFEEISNVSYDPEYSNCIKEGAREIVLDDYYNNKEHHNEYVKKEYFKDWWFRSLIPMELESIFERTNNYRPIPYHHKKVKWRTIATKDEMIPKLKQDNYLYYKMKYWKTKETLNLLYVLHSEMPEYIKTILYKNPMNVEDTPQIEKFLEPLIIDPSHITIRKSNGEQ